MFLSLNVRDPDICASVLQLKHSVKLLKTPISIMDSQLELCVCVSQSVSPHHMAAQWCAGKLFLSLLFHCVNIAKIVGVYILGEDDHFHLKDWFTASV